MPESQPRLVFVYKAWAILLAGGIACIDLLHRFFPSWAICGAFDDDFFYYAVIARHLARGEGSTFDGVHLTNGYHPLWLLCLTLFSAIDSGRWFFQLVTLTAALALACVFVLCVRCLSRFGVAPPGRYVVAALITFWSDLLLRGGMEVTLALPLLLLLLYRWLNSRPRNFVSFFLLGLLSALCVLARLDSLILIALLFFANMVFEFQQGKIWFRWALAFALGLTPLWAYLISNKVIFGSLMPISAQAKQLSFHHGFHLAPLISLLHPLTTVRFLLVLPGLMCIVALLIFLLKKPMAQSSKAVLWPLALFPVLHLIALCLLGDWPLWYWYFYPLVLASFGAIAVLAVSRPLPSRAWTAIAAMLTVVSLGYTLSYNHSRPPRTNDTFLAARDIANFSRSHPGVYAMGDRSGTTGWLLPYPLIQLEGLTMDRRYLAKLRDQPALQSMLRDYGVSYYVATNPISRDGCYLVHEPDQAGPDSAHMSGTFCQVPDATFLHNGVVTRIFSTAESKTGD